MALESYIDDKRRCVIVTVRGDFSFEEIAQMIDRSVRDPAFKPGFGILSDHTRVGEPITTPQVKQLIKHFRSLSDMLAGARWAAVTAKPASYGMLRMIATLAESVPMEVNVFSTIEDAETWLLELKPADT